MADRIPQFQIGQQYKTRGKHPRLCTIVDILTTTNAAGEFYRLRYVSTFDLCGQKVTDYDVPETTVAMGLVRSPEHR